MEKSEAITRVIATPLDTIIEDDVLQALGQNGWYYIMKRAHLRYKKTLQKHYNDERILCKKTFQDNR